MTSNRAQDLLSHSVSLLAQGGAEALSMRNLGQRVGIKPSVIYHYFDSKEELLFKTFKYCSQLLSQSLAQLPANVRTVQELLQQRIEYQFDNAELVVALQQYIMTSQAKLAKFEHDTKIPPQAYHHIVEVLERGIQEGIFVIEDVAAEAKTITHAINGFILEYYPDVPTGAARQQLIIKIHGFILRAVT